MKLKTLLEAPSVPKLCVVYGGRFQPFHLGHYHAYKWLCKKFGEENVWIATSNKTNFNPASGDISPFDYAEKCTIIETFYDIDPRRIVECKNPTFGPKEVFSQYKGYPVVYVAAAGAKDKERYESSDFFTRMPQGKLDLKNMTSVKEHKGYFVNVPSQDNAISGTEIRDALLDAKGKERTALFKQYFGKYDSIVDELIIAKLKDVKTLPAEEPKKEPKEKKPESKVEVSKKDGKEEE
jgi:cytidyltransferase-like protein